MAPQDIEESEIIDYLLDYKSRCKVGSSSINVHICSIRYYFREVLGQQDFKLHFSNPRRRQRLPEIFTRAELRRLLAACGSNEKHRAMFMTMYSSGLRLGELCTLRVENILSQSLQLRVNAGKGQKDRYTILSKVSLQQLRKYYRRSRPGGGWLFNGRDEKSHIARRSVQHAMGKAVQKAKISKSVTLHSFRHTFAVHFLEEGGNILQLKAYLGHAHLSTTMLYLQYLHLECDQGISPLDQWWHSEIS